MQGVIIEAFLGDDVAAAGTTDERGHFTVYLRSAGTYRLRGRVFGFADATLDSISVRGRELVEVTLRMSRAPIPLAGITVESRRRDPRYDASYEGFVARRAAARPVGTERVVLRGDPEMASASTVQAVLKWFLPGRRCYDYYIDGRPVDPRFWASFVMNLPTQFLEGIEYYREDWMRPVGFDPPIRPLGSAGAVCTVVAVWRRRSP
jgi:hypothetical protein